MEILLAMVVASAVIFFGALISIGNERQRKAIDGLREQVVLWAMQDLRIKRERLARDVHVDDPLDWLGQKVSNATGKDLRLQVIELFDDPRALICETVDGVHKFVITVISPEDIRQISRERRGRLAHYVNRNPLFSLPGRAPLHEFSMLNGGLLFDLELQLAWTGLTGERLTHQERLWIYRLA